MVLVFLARYTWPKIIRISRCLKTGCNNVVGATLYLAFNNIYKTH